MRRLPLLLFILLLPCLAHDAPKQDPPGYPTQPPSRIPTYTAPPPVPGQKVWTYSLHPGWNMVSFPLARLTRVEGLTYMLLRPSSAGPVEVDPVHYPERAETGRGYWAYSDRPATVNVSGVANPGDDPGLVILETGWNLVGCPWDKPINFRNTSLAVPGGTYMTLEQAIDVEPCFLFGYAYNYGAKRFLLMSLENPASQLAPQNASWIYARSPCQLNLNLGQAAPRLDTVTREGDAVTIKGAGLGTPVTTTLYFGDHALKNDRATSWTATQIQAPGPAHAVNGTLVVLVNGVPSNRYPVVLGPPPTGVPAAGGLTGQVTDDSNRAVPGARITIDTGTSTFSDDQGRFSFSGLPPGPHAMTASHDGFGGAKGSVTVLSGTTKPVAIMLPLRRGTITVRAYPFPYGQAQFVPSQILMWETKNYSHRYLRDYSYYERGWLEYDLNWEDLPMGNEYSVTVTWKDEQKNEQSITHRTTLDRTNYTDYFYNSWSY